MRASRLGQSGQPLPDNATSALAAAGVSKTLSSTASSPYPTMSPIFNFDYTFGRQFLFS